MEEAVSLTVQEVGIVYDQVQYVEFGKEERRQHMEEFNLILELQEAQEDGMRNQLAAKGGWGVISQVDGTRTKKDEYDRNAISLRDFRKIFSAVSPWKSSDRKGSRRPSMTEEEWMRVGIVDRIYCYSSVYFKMARKGRDNALHGDAYVVDLATIVQVLDVILKQPLNARMRFMFDMHDLDGDGFLSSSELSSAMASFLEIFENEHRDSKRSMRSLSDGAENDQYLKAVSSFLNSALKLGSNKGVQVERDDTVPAGSLNLLGRNSRSSKASGQQDMNVKLSFNEFLMAVLSQAVFVEYFERVWSLSSVNSRVYIIENK